MAGEQSQEQKRLLPLTRVSCPWQGVGAQPGGDWRHAVLVTGLWLIRVSVFMDKLPQKTSVFSGGVPVRFFSQKGARFLNPFSLENLGWALFPCPVASLLCISHLPILDSSLSCCCHLPRWPVATDGPIAAQNLSVLAVFGLIVSAHNGHSIIIS